eukprot:CAMPEP_0184973498 /NCGR_PEP_ID=MMETSP1098-20130426/5252_1 /TAXON_ID=89044 /ORGANISM="Spumella elongata, Strain CCAP 955/1" /LENGTH=36 /DNA_ID= /DNA_START= /DNA_END= /DNA_ORIENTATION=
MAQRTCAVTHAILKHAGVRVTRGKRQRAEPMLLIIK